MVWVGISEFGVNGLNDPDSVVSTKIKLWVVLKKEEIPKTIREKVNYVTELFRKLYIDQDLISERLPKNSKGYFKKTETSNILGWYNNIQWKLIKKKYYVTSIPSDTRDYPLKDLIKDQFKQVYIFVEEDYPFQYIYTAEEGNTKWGNYLLLGAWNQVYDAILLNVDFVEKEKVEELKKDFEEYSKIKKWKIKSSIFQEMWEKADGEEIFVNIEWLPKKTREAFSILKELWENKNKLQNPQPQNQSTNNQPKKDSQRLNIP
jgi:hypothetical protein